MKVSCNNNCTGVIHFVLNYYGKKIFSLDRRMANVVNAPYLAWRSQLVQQRQPGVQLHQDGQGH